MSVRSSLNGLKSIYGAEQVAPAPSSARRSAPTATSARGNDQATVSNAGSAVSLSMENSSVRMEKIASIQAALGAGTYKVSSSTLSTSLVSFMLGSAR